jgi:predicted signal transduction protein with EAL and GGDEF domain
MAVAPEHGTEAETLLRHADSAVQAARKLGGGASVVYSPECEPHDPSHLALLASCGAPSTGTSCSCTIQPKVDLKTRTVVGAEALLRWPHPKRGFVPPAEFIPLAEQTGPHPAPHPVGARPRGGGGARPGSARAGRSRWR